MDVRLQLHLLAEEDHILSGILSMRMILTRLSDFKCPKCLKPSFCRSKNRQRKLVEALIPVQMFQDKNC